MQQTPKTQWLQWASLIALVSSTTWVFLAPIETEMGFVQKIMYLHLPSVLVMYAAFFITFAFSIGYLWKRDPYFDQIAHVSAEIGTLFCAMVLITGAFWGRPTWGTYWVWDARLTTTLLLFLIFMGYGLLRQFLFDREVAARFSAVIAIIGFLDIPIIHKSVEWWNTLHQPSTLFQVNASQEAKPSIPNELLMPLLASMASMLLFYGFLVVLRFHMEQAKTQYHKNLLED